MVKKEECNEECTCNILNFYIDPNDKKDLILNENLKVYDDMIKQNPKVDTVKISFVFPKEQTGVQCSGNFINRNEFIRYLTEMFVMLNNHKDFGKFNCEQFRLKIFWKK